MLLECLLPMTSSLYFNSHFVWKYWNWWKQRR